MKHLLKITLFLCVSAQLFYSCDDILGDKDDEDDGPNYVEPITINSLEVINVTQFSFDVSWELVDGDGKMVDAEDISYDYQTGGFLGLNGSGFGDGFTPEINSEEFGNVIPICGQDISLEITFDVAGLTFDFEETRILDFTPGDCEYDLRLVSSFNGGNSGSCDYYSEWTFTAYNKTYEDRFGEGSSSLFFLGGGDALSEDGLIMVEIVDSQVSNLSNAVITDGALYSFGDLNQFRILGPLVDKVDCSLGSSYDYNAGIVLKFLPDNTQAAIFVIDESYSF